MRFSRRSSRSRNMPRRFSKATSRQPLQLASTGRRSRSFRLRSSNPASDILTHPRERWTWEKARGNTLNLAGGRLRIGGRGEDAFSPTGIRPTAQGCEERATLGQPIIGIQKPQRGFVRFPRAPDDLPETKPRWGLDSRGSFSQGRCFAPTLGCGTDPRWGIRNPLRTIPITDHVISFDVRMSEPATGPLGFLTPSSVSCSIS